MSVSDPVLPAVVWVTRDRVHGDLNNKFDVWHVRPHRELADDGDVIWLPPLELIDGPAPTRVCSLSIDAAFRLFGNGLPDERQCLRVGRSS